MSTHYRVTRIGEITGFVHTSNSLDAQFMQDNPDFIESGLLNRFDFHNYYVENGEVLMRPQFDIGNLEITFGGKIASATVKGLPNGTIARVTYETTQIIRNRLQLARFTFSEYGTWVVDFTQFPYLAKSITVEVI